MPSYAILGATGQTGNSLLEILLQSDKNEIHAYCRSKSKLLGQFPQHANDSRLQIFEGSIEDEKLLANCCRGAKAVFMTVALKSNMPGCRVAQDTASHIVAAMEILRKEKETRLPMLIMLNSASTEPHLCRNMPRLEIAMIYRAMWYIYKDLEAAERFLRSKSDWIDTVFIKPGILSHDVQGGHELSLETMADRPVSFLDLAAGMVEAADAGEEYVGKAVSVLPKSAKVNFPWEAPGALFKGLLYCYFPWLWGWLGD